MADATQRTSLLKTLNEAWNHHPEWSFGRLVHAAAAITRGQLQVNPRGLSNEEIEGGLRALVPSEWELEKDAK